MMDFPPFPDINNEHLQAIAERHNLGTDAFTLLPQIGIFNKVYQVGDDYILRIARDHPKSFVVARREAIAVPLARAVGVHTPNLLVMDDTCDIIPVPYTIYERVRGETLELLHLEPHETPNVWRAVGRDLARLHTTVEYQGAATQLDHTETSDLTSLPDELAEAGYFTGMEARWLTQWLARLAPAATAPITPCFLHGDNQMSNIMVCVGSLDYLAFIDWGNAGWGDPAFDFAGIPLRAVPYMLAGYRQIAPLTNDETAEARILWRHLELAFGNLSRGPEPDLSWAERPLPFLLEIMRFLLETTDSRWSEFMPFIVNAGYLQK